MIIISHFCLCLHVFREEAIEAAPTNVTVPPGSPAVLSCRTHLALHGHMSWVRIYPETGRVEELANSTEVYRQVTLVTLSMVFNYHGSNEQKFSVSTIY